MRWCCALVNNVHGDLRLFVNYELDMLKIARSLGCQKVLFVLRKVTQDVICEVHLFMRLGANPNAIAQKARPDLREQITDPVVTSSTTTYT